MWEDDEIFKLLVVLLTLIKYILYQAHDVLGHNGTARTYWYLKGVCY